MAVSYDARVSPRSTDPGPLLRAAPWERQTTLAAAATGMAAAGWVWFAPGARDLEGVVRVAAALPAFALGFGAVMLAAAAAADLVGGRRR